MKPYILRYDTIRYDTIHNLLRPTCTQKLTNSQLNLQQGTKKKANEETKSKLECGPMPNLMVALSNIGGALCSTPQSFADSHY